MIINLITNNYEYIRYFRAIGYSDISSIKSYTSKSENYVILSDIEALDSLLSAHSRDTVISFIFSSSFINKEISNIDNVDFFIYDNDCEVRDIVDLMNKYLKRERWYVKKND